MEKENTLTVAVLGAGNIGSAMARGLAGSGHTVHLYNRGAARLESFGSMPGVVPTQSLEDALRGADLSLICVEGHAVMPLIGAMGRFLESQSAVVGSCAAAISTDELSEALGRFVSQPKVFRLLPNIAATAGKSTNLLCAKGIGNSDLSVLQDIFECTGTTLIVEERLFPAAMALSSCGIAYAMRYVRATMSAGVQMGLSPAVAEAITAGVLDGTAALLASGKRPEELIDAVTTPGGLTIRGLNAMEAAGFTPSVIAGLTAAAKV